MRNEIGGNKPTEEEVEQWNLEMDIAERVGRWLQGNITTKLPPSSHSSDIAGIDYRAAKRKFNIKELHSLALFDLCAEHSITRDAHRAYLEVINSSETIQKTKTWDPRTTQKLVSKMTQIEAIAYDCCINSCMCFTGKYATLQVCKICSKSWRNQKNQPFKIFSYLPIILRI